MELFAILFSVFATGSTRPFLELFIHINSVACFLSVHSSSRELEQLKFLFSFAGVIIYLHPLRLTDTHVLPNATIIKNKRIATPDGKILLRKCVSPLTSHQQ